MPEAELACDLGDALANAGKFRAALAEYSRSIQLQPDLGRPYYSAGCAATALEEFVTAKKCFAKAVDLEPQWLEARHNLARALYELGQVTDAFRHFEQAAQMDRAGSEHSLAMLAVIAPGVPDVSQARILEVRKSWSERYLQTNLPGYLLASTDGRLKVGYVSSFFHRDNWMKPVWGLIKQHDRSAIHVFLFSDSAVASLHPDDEVLNTSALSNDELAQLIASCHIDVLVDLNGYSNMRRLPLFAGRPAPVTIGWFNMYATTGMHGFDYLIGDSQVVLPEEERYYSEKILRVRGSYLTFEVNYPVPPVTVRPAAERRGIVFGVTASQYKITDEVIASWSRILAASPHSSLLLKNKQLASRYGRDFMLERFAQQGIPAGRLQLEGPEDHYEFLKVYNRIDIVLDTFPYNGGTTTTEAIWQGVPVLAFHGDRWASRTSASILRAGGLEEFVADDLKGYELLAIGLANNADTLEKLAILREQMRERLRNSPVCDTVGFARHMEQLYRTAINASVCNKLAPDG